MTDIEKIKGVLKILFGGDTFLGAYQQMVF